MMIFRSILTPRFSHRLLTFIEIVGLLVFILGMLNTFGYFFNPEKAFLLFGEVRMAFSTALCFTVIGFSIFLLANSVIILEVEPLPRERTVVVGPADIIGIICILGSFVLMALGHNREVVGILVTIVGFYFGRFSRNR